MIAGDVGDHPEAYTRFVSIGNFVRLDVNGKAWRTAFSFVTDHQPGALHRAIEPFARHRIDLLQLVSRPIPQTPWRYRFDAGARGPSSRPDRARDAARDSREHTAAPPVRFVPCGGARVSEPGTDPTVQQLREEIAAVDRAILHDVNARIELVTRIRSRKAEAGIPFVDPDRERELIEELGRGTPARSLRKASASSTRLLDLTKREVGGDADP